MNKNLIWAVIIILIVAGGAVMLVRNAGRTAEEPLGESAENPAGIVEEGSSINDGPSGSLNISAPDPEVREFTVSGKNYSFSPSVINVKKGDRVKITFMSAQGFHDFIIDEYGVATKQMQAPGTEVIEFTADKAGTFEYYCSVGSHKLMGMAGILKVE